MQAERQTPEQVVIAQAERASGSQGRGLGLRASGREPPGCSVGGGEGMLETGIAGGKAWRQEGVQVYRSGSGVEEGNLSLRV